MKNYVINLLETYHDRERKIAVLRYNLAHPAKVSTTEQIETMTYGHGDGLGHTKGRVSNKTLYIALNYEEQAARMNAEVTSEIANELFELGVPLAMDTARSHASSMSKVFRLPGVIGTNKALLPTTIRRALPFFGTAML
ncbi:hypothetical protein [Dysosmobacter sp.]|uniref:hypothetical protein n=1 Tax=Dysosmobacter sp. TaxID=2591382 RepID=UPI002DB6CC4C|nr:hypothetical protein [Dysosmobacter sp.]